MILGLFPFSEVECCMRNYLKFLFLLQITSSFQLVYKNKIRLCQFFILYFIMFKHKYSILIGFDNRLLSNQSFVHTNSDNHLLSNKSPTSFPFCPRYCKSDNHLLYNKSPASSFLSTPNLTTTYCPTNLQLVPFCPHQI